MELILPITYFAPISFYTTWYHAKSCIIDMHEHYNKKGFHNRAVMLSSQGFQTLSIPLKNGRSNQRQSISEVEICYTQPWQSQHWRSIVAAYGKSPYFIFYKDKIESCIFNTNKSLVEFNLICHQAVSQILKHDFNFQPSHSYIKEQKQTDSIDLRNAFTHNHFEQYESAYYHKQKYPQCFEEKIGFKRNVSVLDLLFNIGNSSQEFLKASYKP